MLDIFLLILLSLLNFHFCHVFLLDSIYHYCGPIIRKKIYSFEHSSHLYRNPTHVVVLHEYLFDNSCILLLSDTNDYSSVYCWVASCHYHYKLEMAAWFFSCYAMHTNHAIFYCDLQYPLVRIL